MNSGEERDIKAPVVLTKAANEFEATAIVTALKERSVYAKAVGGFTASFAVEAPGDVSIVVRQAELEAAKIALAEIKSLEKEIDWSKVDVGEPEWPLANDSVADESRL